MQAIRATATFDLHTARLVQDAPVHCETCGSRVATISPILMIDRIRDAADYCDGLEIVPESVRIDRSGLVEVMLDQPTFDRVTANLPVRTTNRAEVGMQLLEATDGHFRLCCLNPIH